jgi:hypothetical protein
VIAKIVETGLLAKRTGREIVDAAELAKLRNEAHRIGFEAGVLEAWNKYGIRYHEPEAPRDRFDMLDRVSDAWFERVAAISKGADLRYDDATTRAAAAAKMVQNMIENPRQFAKSVFDPAFKSRVTQRELLQKIDEE